MTVIIIPLHWCMWQYLNFSLWLIICERPYVAERKKGKTVSITQTPYMDREWGCISRKYLNFTHFIIKASAPRKNNTSRLLLWRWLWWRQVHAFGIKVEKIKKKENSFPPLFYIFCISWVLSLATYFVSTLDRWLLRQTMVFFFNFFS